MQNLVLICKFYTRQHSLVVTEYNEYLNGAEEPEKESSDCHTMLNTLCSQFQDIPSEDMNIELSVGNDL